MKKISFIIGAAVLAASVFTGCQKKNRQIQSALCFKVQMLSSPQ